MCIRDSLGANAENTAQHLHQYAVLGSFYAKNVRGIAQPRVGLLNNGTESSKGDPLRKETYELLAADESLNFIGNVEARDLMNGVADVVVADGFTGNACLLYTSLRCFCKCTMKSSLKCLNLNWQR